MTFECAIRIAQKLSLGRVCTLREGEAQEYNRMALSALREQEQRRWISVEEKLPEAFVPVLVQMPGKDPFPAVRTGFVTADGIWHGTGFA